MSHMMKITEKGYLVARMTLPGHEAVMKLATHKQFDGKDVIVYVNVPLALQNHQQYEEFKSLKNGQYIETTKTVKVLDPKPVKLQL